jgi:HEAT repeat protein
VGGPEPGSLLASPPDRRVHGAVEIFGAEAVALWCGDLLAGRVAATDPDRPNVAWLGGRHAQAQLERGGLDSPEQAYWPRVWAARGLLYAWDPAAGPDVVRALGDPAWRVREMAAKVVHRRELGEAAEALGPLLRDATARVRSAAVRAVGLVAEWDLAADVDRLARTDRDKTVRATAGRAMADLERRLDRRFTEQ